MEERTVRRRIEQGRRTERPDGVRLCCNLFRSELTWAVVALAPAGIPRGVALMLGAVAVAATLLPARAAARLDPMTALRTE